MPDRTKLAVLALSLFAVLLAAAAQDRDRDTRGIPATSSTAPPPEARVDINSATPEELMKVKGITRSWAGRIIRFRPYRAKSDLEELGVVPPALYDHIKDFIIAHHLKQ